MNMCTKTSVPVSLAISLHTLSPSSQVDHIYRLKTDYKLANTTTNQVHWLNGVTPIAPADTCVTFLTFFLRQSLLASNMIHFQWKTLSQIHLIVPLMLRVSSRHDDQPSQYISRACTTVRLCPSEKAYLSPVIPVAHVRTFLGH